MAVATIRRLLVRRHLQRRHWVSQLGGSQLETVCSPLVPQWVIVVKGHMCEVARQSVLHRSELALVTGCRSAELRPCTLELR